MLVVGLMSGRVIVNRVMCIRVNVSLVNVRPGKCRSGICLRVNVSRVYGFG